MTLGNAWAFPAASHERGAGGDAGLAERCRASPRRVTRRPPAGPGRVLEPAYLKAAADLSGERQLPSPIPKLAALVVASAFDAALHDAYGKAFGLSAYRTYGPDFMAADLSPLPGPRIPRGVPGAVRGRGAAPPCRVFHSIGASDPLEAADVKQPLDDGLPDTSRSGSPGTA